MKVLEKSKNGQAILVSKTGEELTEQEKNMVALKGSNFEDYQTFRVNYNKRGELVRAWGYGFTEERNNQIERDREKAQKYRDGLSLLFANNHGKQYRQARARRGDLDSKTIKAGRSIVRGCK